MGIKHAFHSGIVDGADTTKVRPTLWNSDHIIDGPINLPAGSTLNGGPFSTVPGPSIFKNVRSYGAVGDGVTDDAPAIQAALDDHSGSYTAFNVGIIYFPVGTYKIGSAIDYSRINHLHVGLLGDPGASITANFAGPMFIRPFAGGITYTVFWIEGLQFTNNNVAGGCIDIGDNLTTTIRNCIFTAANGGTAPLIRTLSGSVYFYNCVFLGGGITSSSVGILGGDIIAQACQFVGCGTGIRAAFTPALTAIANAFEVNGIAIEIGGNFTDSYFGGGSNEAALGATIIGGHFESNNKHIHVQNGSMIQVRGVKMASFNVGNTHGIHCDGAVADLGVTDTELGAANYSVGGIVIQPIIGGNAQRIHFQNVLGASWVIDTNVDTTSWNHTDYSAAWTNKYLDYTGAFGFTATNVAATIASGAITVTGNYMVIDTEAAAASDDLDTISGAPLGSTGSRLILRAANSARTVVVKDGTGNLQLAGDFSMDNAQDTMELIWDGLLNVWLEIGRSDNGA